MPLFRRVLPLLAIALPLAACAHPVAPRQEAAIHAAAGSPAVRLHPVEQWPLKFKSHSFSAHCYDTYGCKVFYAGLQQRNDDSNQLRPSSASYGYHYHRGWTGSHGMIRNFPPPAEVSWRSKDGQAHQARIDIGQIFADEVILHRVAREEMADVPEGRYDREPLIILEINDRTIRVWMRATIDTKELQRPGNPYSDYRDDLILAKTYTF